MSYELRWHATNVLFRFGLWIAPRGAARDTLILWLEDFSNHIVDTVSSQTQEGKSE